MESIKVKNYYTIERTNKAIIENKNTNNHNKGESTMIRVFSGGRYTLNHWLQLCEILEHGLHDVCCNNCDNCKYTFACREVSQAITYCSKNANGVLAKRGNK